MANVDVVSIVERYKTLQRYIQWCADDALRVRSTQSILLPHLGPLIDDFYATIEQFPEAVKVITGGQVQIERLNAELRTTTQRVNLFEKVKIPESRQNIKRIRIYLGDQQTAQVVRGKIAKRKVERSAS